MKIFLILPKALEKQKLNISRSALVHIKTRAGLKYFVNDCRFEQGLEENYTVDNTLSIVDLLSHTELMTFHFLLLWTS